MKKIFFLLITSILFITISSCSEETEKETKLFKDEIELDLSNLELKNWEEYDLSKVSSESVYDSIISRLYKSDSSKKSDNMDQPKIVGYQIIGNNNFLTIFPINSEENNLNNEEGIIDIADEVDKGISKNDNKIDWSYIKNCDSEECVQEAILTSTQNLTNQLKAEECINTRIERNSIGVNIRVRKILCDD